MKMPDRKLVAGLLVGVLIGWFAAYGAMHCRARFDKPGKSHMLDKFTRELRLDAAQKEKVGLILEETREKVKALRGQTRPRFEAIRAESDGRIRAVLTPEQLPRFEKLRAEMQEKFKKRSEGRLSRE